MLSRLIPQANKGNNMKSKFTLANGDLSAYAFACGYIQTYIWGNQELSLSHSGGFVYDLRGYDQAPFKRLFWETYESLGEARKAYKKRVKEMKTSGMMEDE
jgi:hypothetical protein